jgi:hypothetical protein
MNDYNDYLPPLSPAPPQHQYIAYYKGRKMIVFAPSSADAQSAAASQFGARRRHEVTVLLYSSTPTNLRHL